MPMRLLAPFLLALYGLPSLALANRPHIVVILVDDLGFADLGCFGSEIATPNLDRLAEHGLRFTQFYSTAKCHSSRVSLLTGLYSNQAGQESLVRGATMAQVLRNAGYFTAMVGKWHLHDQPTDHGFSHYWGHLSGATNYFEGDASFRLDGRPWKGFGNGFYNTIANADHAIEFIDQAGTSGKPLFLYLAFNAPHYPLQCLEEDYRLYEERYVVGWDAIRAGRLAKQERLGLFDEHLTPAPRPDHVVPWDQLEASDQAWEARRMAAYAAMVHRLDREIGRVVDHLREAKMLDDTMLLFLSDNGACPFDRTRGKELEPWDPKSYWCYDTGWAHVGNTPFRLYKQNQHEGGITSPTIAHWPKGMAARPGSVTDQPAHLIDVMATVIDLGRATYPTSDHQGAIEPLQGKSLVPILAGTRRDPHEALFFRFAQNRAVRVGDLKLVSFRGGPWELYDLAMDRTELKDLAAHRSDQVEKLAARWMHWAEHVNLMPLKQRQPVKRVPQKPNF